MAFLDIKDPDRQHLNKVPEVPAMNPNTGLKEHVPVDGPLGYEPFVSGSTEQFQSQNFIKAQNKIAQGEALSQIELQRAQQIAALSPQDFAAASGATQAMTNPQWFGAALEGDLNAPVPGLKKTIEDPVSGNPRSVDATVSDVNMLVDQLSAASAVARQLYTQNSPADAYAHLADFYNRVPNPTWFSSLGIPTTAYEAYVDLFGQPPF